MPINAFGDREGDAFAWFSIHALIGGLAVVGFSLVHAGFFLMLKTDGDIRHRARSFAVKLGPLLLVPLMAWVLIVQVQNGKLSTWALIAVAVAAVIFTWLQARMGREAQAFIGLGIFLLAGVASIFASVYPVVLPSTLNSTWDLTVSNASSSPYTLRLMSFVAAFGVPLVLAYQGWTYWVFRQRISTAHIPDAHAVVVAEAVPESTPVQISRPEPV